MQRKLVHDLQQQTKDLMAHKLALSRELSDHFTQRHPAGDATTLEDLKRNVLEEITEFPLFPSVPSPPPHHVQQIINDWMMVRKCSPLHTGQVLVMTKIDGQLWTGCSDGAIFIWNIEVNIQEISSDFT